MFTISPENLTHIINVQKWNWKIFYMDYEVMMNGTVKIGQIAPDFEAVTTFGNIQLSKNLIVLIKDFI